MGQYLDHGSGYSRSRDSYQAGVEAAQHAIKQIVQFEPTLVVVFASVYHELERALAGVRKVTGDVPLVGCTTSGEYCDKLIGGTVTVNVFASPYMDVKIGLGCRLSRDCTSAVQQVIKSGGAEEFFNVYTGVQEDENKSDFTQKPFALVFMPGPTRKYSFKGREVIDLLRKRSLNSLPLVGACAGDDCRWETTHLFYNGEVLEDCLVIAFVKTHLRFGIATSCNYIPMEPKVTVTKCKGNEILEFNGQPAADFFAMTLGVDFGEFMVNPSAYLYKCPFGVRDFLGFYHLIPGLSVTPDHGISCLSPIEEGIAINFMEPSAEQLLASAEEFLRKSILRGRITKPEVGLIFSSIHRVNSLRELIPLSLQKIQKSAHSSICLSGFCTYGEIGLTEEGIGSLFNMTLSGIIIGDELTEAAYTVQKNKELYRELRHAAEINKELYQELSMVHELGNLLNSSLKLGFVINKAVQMVAELMKADGCIMFLYDEDSDIIKTVSHFGFGEFSENIDLKETLPYYALKKKKKLLVNEGSRPSHVDECIFDELGARSAIISPIVVKKQKVGVIAVYSKEKEIYVNKDLEFLETLANQIGIAVVNADLYERTELLACTDGLTGLFDHNYFLKALNKLLSKAKAKEQPLSLIMVDLDDFKFYNDKYGHTVGDTILQTTAKILIENVRSEDVISRYGGDEFAVILVNTGEKKAAKISERIATSLAHEPFSDPESKNVFYITASLGVATFNASDITGKELIDLADKAMYQMKRNNKAKTESYLTEFEELESQLSASEKALLDTIKILIQVLDSRDRYTWEHCRQVARYAIRIASKMGLSKEAISKIKLAAYLHDMGKIHVSPEVLNKRGWLDSEEMDLVKLHPVVGANLIAPIKGFGEVREIIYYHHEWFNGQGYPQGLKGKQIPLGARILAAADGFDAMTSNRPYRKAKSYNWALRDLKNQSGTQYDPQVVKAFLEVLKE